MDSRRYIINQQVPWARKRGIELIGSEGERGEKTYTAVLEQNLFEPLDPAVRQMFLDADGDELTQRNGWPAKMQALHSSSSLAVNLFHYFWKRPEESAAIAKACRVSNVNDSSTVRITFEEKFPILSDAIMQERGTKPPNIDVVLRFTSGEGDCLCAIECKFTEPFRKDLSTAKKRRDYGMADRYFENEEIWEGLPNLRKLADSLHPEDTTFKYLHAAQLIKHVLGLKRQCNGKDPFRLIYLHADVPGEAGDCHRREIEQFASVAEKDSIEFDGLTMQELIRRLAETSASNLPEYTDYVCQRYCSEVLDMQ